LSLHRRIAVRTLPLLLLPALTGCGTILGLSLGGDSPIYIGTQLDARNVGGGFGPCSMGLPMPFALLDLPLSFGLDTVLFPFTLTYELVKPEPKPPGQREEPAVPSAWTKQDSWYRPALQDPRVAHATPIDPARVHEVPTSREHEAEELLRETPTRELTPEEARHYSGQPVVPVSGTKPYLVRGVLLNSGTFTLFAKDRTLWIEHGSRGHRPVPMKRRALVVQLEHAPANVFCTCGMAD
jgi:uncharacterized protein YceK